MKNVVDATIAGRAVTGSGPADSAPSAGDGGLPVRTLGVAVAVCLGGFIFGFDASVISGVVGYVTAQYGLNVWQQGLVVSAPTLAAVLASLTVVPLSDVFGRKRMLLTVAALYLVSAVGSAFATGFWTLVAARAIGGLAFGSLMVTPIYIAEIAPARLRGVLVSVNQMTIVVGLSAAYFANYLLVKLAGTGGMWVEALGIGRHTWRWMLGLEILPAAVWVACLFGVPESPRWLVVKGRIEAARAAFARLGNATRVNERIDAVRATLRDSGRESAPGLRALLSPRLRFALTIGFIVAVAQQITGINAVFFFATGIFELSGIGTDAAFAQAVWVGLINVVFTVAAMVLVDRLGRRPLLIAGLAGAAVSMGVAAWGFHSATYVVDSAAIERLRGEVDVALVAPLEGRVFDSDISFKAELARSLGEEELGRHGKRIAEAAVRMNPFVVLAGILGFVASFAVSLGPVMWVVLSEIFPNDIRGMAMAAIGFANAGVSFLVQFLFPWELSVLGNAGTFAVYAAFAVIGLVLVARLMPETKGKSLEELERELARA